jgi:hypothetical protein
VIVVHVSDVTNPLAVVYCTLLREWPSAAGAFAGGSWLSKSERFMADYCEAGRKYRIGNDEDVTEDAKSQVKDHPEYKTKYRRTTD